MHEIPTAVFLKQMADEGLVSYEKEVLEGPLFKKIIIQIEDAALAGYAGRKNTLNGGDDIRALKVIQKELQSKGFYCEFEMEDVRGLMGTYKEQFFHVKWGE